MLQTRLGKLKCLLVCLLSVLLIFTSFVLGTNDNAHATETLGTIEDASTTKTLEGTREGVVFRGKGTKCTNAMFKFDLTSDNDNGITLPTGSKYLAVYFTGYRPSSDSDSVASLFYLIDKDGNIAHNNGLGSIYVPALELGTSNNTLRDAQFANNGMYYRYRKHSSGQLKSGVAFIPFSIMKNASNTANVDLANVEQLVVDTNLASPNRGVELLKIEVTTLPDLTPDTANGKFTINSANATAAEVTTAMNSGSSVTLVDFTTWTQDYIDTSFANGDFTSYMCDDRNSIVYMVQEKNYNTTYVYGNTFTYANQSTKYGFFAENNEDLLKVIDIEKTYEYEVTELDAYVNLTSSMENALTIRTKDDAIGTSKTTTDENYDNIRNSYLQVWSSETAVTANDGIAIKFYNFTNSGNIRVFLYSTTGQIYYVGYNGGSKTDPYLYNAIKADGTKTTVKSYGKMLYLGAGEHTVFVPYETLTQVTDSKSNAVAVNKTIGQITDINKVAVVYDNTADSLATIKKNIRFAIGSVADIDIETNTITEIFDTADYTWATSETDTTADINGFNSALGATVRGINKEDDNGNDQPWKNESYALGKVVSVNYDVEGDVTSSYANTTLSYSLNAAPTTTNAFVGWTTDNENVTDLYKAGTSYKVTSSVTFYAATLDIQMSNGAKVFLKDNHDGIRFDSKISSADLTKFGDKITDIGTLVLPTKYLESKDFLYENFEMGVTCLDIERDGWLSQGDYNEFAAAVVDFASKSHYSLEYSARAYAVVTYTDGSTAYVYSNYDKVNNSRSVYQVASNLIGGGVEESAYAKYIGAIADVTISGGELVLAKDFDSSVVIVENSFSIEDTTYTFVMDGEVNSVILNGVRLLTNSNVGASVTVTIDGVDYAISNLVMNVENGQTTVTFSVVEV